MTITSPAATCAPSEQRSLESWGAVAPAWGDFADELDERAEDVTDQLVTGLRLTGSERVLELAAGTGSAGIAVAETLAGSGQVVITDLVPEMVRLAAQRVAARGLTNVRTRVFGFDGITEPDSSYDGVLCREGLMFATDHAAAVAQIHRVLVPGGRAAVSVWGSPADNPWLASIFRTMSEVLDRPLPPPGVHGPFALGDPAVFCGLFEAAGFRDVTLTAGHVDMSAPGFDAWWSRTRELVGPLSLLLRSLPAGALAEVEARLRVAMGAHQRPDGTLKLTGNAHVLTATR